MNHGISDLKAFLDGHDRFLVFGAGSGGQAVRAWLERRGKVVEGYLDNDVEKQGRDFDGLPVMSPGAMGSDSPPVVIASLWTATIARQLAQEYGLRAFVHHLPLYNLCFVDVPQYGDALGREFDAYYAAHRKCFLEAGEVFANEDSRLQYRRVVEFRRQALSPEVPAPEALPCSDARYSQLKAQAPQWLERLPEALDSDICRSAAELLSVGVYSYGEQVDPARAEVIIDGGAFVGDSAAMFATLAPQARIFAFEPGPEQFQRLKVMEPFYPGLEAVPAGLWSKSGNQEFNLSAGDLSSIHAGDGDALPVYSLDDFVAQRKLTRVDFVKLDIEGAEPRALEGMMDTLERFRPDLALSIYHRAEHLWWIPLWLKRNFPGYRLFLEHRNVSPLETICFAVWESGR